MSLRDGPLGELKAAVAWLAAAALIVAAIVALALFVTAGSHPQTYAPVRATADKVEGGAGGVLSVPVRWTGDLGADIEAYFLAGSQNRELRADLAAALSWRDEALALRQENARLRAVLSIRTVPPIPMVSADTVLDARGPFSNSRLADVGSDQGVTEGNPVLSDHGLVGRIAGVGPTVSRVMLLTDVESRMPVMIARINGRAILTGDGGPDPALDYLRTHDAPRAGDRVLTSGDGGVAPRGLPVGSVVKGSDGAWRVVLDSDAAPIEFVRILLFRNFSQLTAATALAPLTLPTTDTQPPPATPPAATAPPPAKTP